jgi:four helix bundle protein
MSFNSIENMRVYRRAERVGDLVWSVATTWPDFAKRSIGLQLVRAADSAGANIAEGLGRYHPAGVIKFMYYARGSLRETIFWLRRARSRGLMEAEQFDVLIEELDALGKELNRVVNHQRQRKVEPTKSRS